MQSDLKPGAAASAPAYLIEKNYLMNYLHQWWEHSPHLISEPARLLAPCHILPLCPEAFWLESISESASKKWASECAGLHAGPVIASVALLIAHVCSIVYENNLSPLVIERTHCQKGFTLLLQPISAARCSRRRTVAIKSMRGWGEMEGDVLVAPIFLS